jgi:U3 small nucleolar RNA-associated protein 11
MSSLRNAVKRVTHKERSQPQSRKHLGLLEKKDDYKLRSRDFKNKSDRLKSMRTKAANRNPDEFYFGMHRGKVDGMSGRDTGRHLRTDEGRRIEMEKNGLGPEGVRIMKDQDLAYLRMRRSMDERKIERLQGTLHYLDVDDDHGGYGRGRGGRHTIFVEGGRSTVDDFDVAGHFDTMPELVGRAFNRPRLGVLPGMGGDSGTRINVPSKDADDQYYNDDDGDGDDDAIGEAKAREPTEKQILKSQRQRKRLERAVAKSRSASYSEMELRRKRLEKLKIAEMHLIAEKQANMTGRKRRIVEGGHEVGAGEGGGKPAVYKWRRKRAR